MRGRGSLPVVAGVLALLTVVAAIAVNVVSGYLPAAVTGRRSLWIAVTCGLAAVIAALTWLSNVRPARKPGVGLSQVPPTVGWVDRAELGLVVAALRRSSTDAVAVTMALVGAGGFGKTMLAARACKARAIRRRYRGGICWVTVGRDLHGTGLAARISEAITNLGGEGPGFVSVEGAGQALAAALASRRGQALLVADDVWTIGQLQPFLAAGQAARLLVTTRRPALLSAAAAFPIMVDALPVAVARRLLAQGLPPISAQLEQELLDRTGGWPLLLNLVNQRLADNLRRGGVIEMAAADAAARLMRDGPAALDIADPDSRQCAIAATVDYSLDALEPPQQDRFYELSIFAEDAEVPLEAVSLLWQATAGLNSADAQALLERLDGLSLLAIAWAANSRVIVVHDVIRDLAAGRVGPSRGAAVHAALLDAIRPAAGPDQADGGEQRRCMVAGA